jgi:hypothetical protein
VKKIFSFLLLVVSYQLSITPPVFAADEFETSQIWRYQANADGQIHVSQEISLKNKLSSVYATRYSLTLPSEKIENIVATDKVGPLKTEVRRENGGTTIVLFFNEQAVGLGKTSFFRLDYDQTDLIKKNGQIWEIRLPKLTSTDSSADYQISLAMPTAFGEPAFINPEPVEKKVEPGFNLYRFTKNQLLDSGVSAAFGRFQIFDFALNYHLENPNLVLGETEIALPPDTAFQQLSYQKIDPPPLKVRIDSDGNWLATYRLKPAEKVKVVAIGKAKIFASAQPNFSPQSPPNLAQNLKPDRYWETDSSLVKNAVQNLKTPRALYDFVVKTLTYDFSQVNQPTIERKGAAAALISPQSSICMEFTDLFVAAARAAGLPAPENNG